MVRATIDLGCKKSPTAEGAVGGRNNPGSDRQPRILWELLLDGAN